MKFSKIAVLGALLASAPFALADTLYGDISTSGTATITATAITFALPISTKTSIHYDQSKGAVIGQGTGGFSNFDSTADMYYVTGATSTTQNAQHQYTGRTPAKFTFPLTLGVPMAAPVELYTVTENGKTLTLFLTEIDTVVVGAIATKTGSGPTAVITPAKTGSFTGLAYVTETGSPTKTYGTFTLTNNGSGPGQKTFSSDFIALTPEPSGLVLLGTAMIGAAGMIFRKRRQL